VRITQRFVQIIVKGDLDDMLIVNAVLLQVKGA